MTLLAALGPSIALIGLLLLVFQLLDRVAPITRRVVTWLPRLLMLRYLWWRTTETLPEPALDWQSVISWLFYVIEVICGIAGLIFLHVMSRTSNRTEQVDAALRRVDPAAPAPLIDVLIATYNESREILLRTIAGATAQDYPNYRVWVLDDGRRDWLRDLAAEKGVGYIIRPDNLHAKAGNLNHALRHLNGLPQPATYIAVLDADFVPFRSFLRRGSVLLADPSVGCVQTPQHFFNPDPLQLNLLGETLMPDEQRFFFDILLSAKDGHGTAFCCGTSSLAKVEALRAIGGFPTESVTEDMLLSLKLSSVGYSTLYLNEPLSMGLAPEGLREYLTQRSRWCLGIMQIARSRWGVFGRARLPLLHRLHLLDSVMGWIASSVCRLALMALLPVCWLSGTQPVLADIPTLVDHLAPMWLSMLVVVAWLSRGTHLPLFADATALIASVEVSKSTVSGLLIGGHKRFKVTAKGGSRTQVTVQWQLLRWLLGLAAATIVGLVVGLLTASPARADGTAINVFWSVYNLLVLSIACFICIEMPRRRAEERFATNEPGVIETEIGSAFCRIVDISLIGLQIRTEMPVINGEAVSVRLDGVGMVPAEIVRAGVGGNVAIRLLPDDRTRDALIRKLYSGQYHKSVHSFGVADALRLLVRRFAL